MPVFQNETHKARDIGNCIKTTVPLKIPRSALELPEADINIVIFKNKTQTIYNCQGTLPSPALQGAGSPTLHQQLENKQDKTLFSVAPMPEPQTDA